MENIEQIALQLASSKDRDEKQKLAKTIIDMAYEKGIYPWSIHDLYLARGR